MKLQKELNYTLAQFKRVKRNCPDIMQYAQKVYSGKGYDNFITRISFDIAYACIPTSIKCEWYDKYNCNDIHMGSLFKRALKEVFPEIYALGENKQSKAEEMAYKRAVIKAEKMRRVN